MGKQCNHDEWIKICVYCGDVLDDSETQRERFPIGSTNKTKYITASYPPNNAIQADPIIYWNVTRKGKVGFMSS